MRVEGDILVAGDVGVQERGGARPVLGRGRRVEQARQRARGACAPEHVAGHAGHRIARWRGGEREEIDRILLVLEMAGVARGLREAVVEAALAAAGDVDQRAIEGHAPGLVHVQRLPQHVLDHPAGLRRCRRSAPPRDRARRLRPGGSRPRSRPHARTGRTRWRRGSRRGRARRCADPAPGTRPRRSGPARTRRHGTRGWHRAPAGRLRPGRSASRRGGSRRARRPAPRAH